MKTKPHYRARVDPSSFQRTLSPSSVSKRMVMYGRRPSARSGGDPIPRYGVPAPMQGAAREIEAFALYAGQSVGLIRDLRHA